MELQHALSSTYLPSDGSIPYTHNGIIIDTPTTPTPGTINIKIPYNILTTYQFYVTAQWKRDSVILTSS
jgi:hypothetical protein